MACSKASPVMSFITGSQFHSSFHSTFDLDDLKTNLSPEIDLFTANPAPIKNVLSSMHDMLKAKVLRGFYFL